MNELGVNVQLDEYSVILLIASLENDIACVKAGYLIKFQISHFIFTNTRSFHCRCWELVMSPITTSWFNHVWRRSVRVKKYQRLERIILISNYILKLKRVALNT